MDNQNKLAGLQIARGLAALGIAYFHSWNVTMAFPEGSDYPIAFLKSWGWIAVDFFFVISGFVVCMIASRPTFDRFEFIAKRIFRIYPLWICASLFFLYLAFHPVGFHERDTWSFVAYSLTLLPTYKYPFYDVGWSLQHEMMFYVLATIFIPRIGAIGLAGLLTAAFTAAKLYDLPWWFEQFSAYYLHFAAGIVAFTLYPLAQKIPALMLIAAGMALLYTFTFVFGAVAFPLAFLVAILGFANLKISPNSRLSALAVSIGDASFGIYLIHTLVFWYTFWMLKSWWSWAPVWSAELFRFGAIAFTCWVAILSWRHFEKPIMRVAFLRVPYFKLG